MEWPHAYLNLWFYPEDLQFQLSSKELPAKSLDIPVQDVQTTTKDCRNY